MKLFLTVILVSNLLLLCYAKDTSCGNSSCAVKGESIKFCILGDWGGKSRYPYTTNIQFRVADGLAKLNTKKSIHFYLSTGDNFYERGVKNDKDSRFKKTFEYVYDRKGHQKPWYLIAGNHDHNGNVSAQIAYSKISERWNFPSTFYTFMYQTSNNITAEFIMIDAIELCGQVTDDASEQNTSYEVKTKEQSKKWDWINDKLNSSNATYLFVVGHYPIYSAGFHGSNRCMIKYLKPLLEMHNVNGYLSGHDHNIQHLITRTKESNWTLNYVVSGLASKSDAYVRSTRKLGPAKLKMFYPDKTYRSFDTDKETGGFVYCHLQDDYGKFSFRDGDGKELYSAKFLPRPI